MGFYQFSDNEMEEILLKATGKKLENLELTKEDIDNLIKEIRKRCTVTNFSELYNHCQEYSLTTGQVLDCENCGFLKECIKFHKESGS